MSRRIAVVLFNLGGPDGPEDVRPFLQNLFSDPAIIQAPGPVRWMLSRLISSTRAKPARANYAIMGGGSPLLPETRRQAEALEAVLKRRGHEARCIIAMRYWKPFVADAVREAKAMAPDAVVLLPLYPQFSTTTTGSSLAEWRRLAPDMPGRTVCCYPTTASFVRSHADAVLKAWAEGGSPENVRLLISAHGLPERVIAGGDPYQWQVEQTARELVQALGHPEWEHQVCYQSRVGPLKWIGPPTDAAIRAAAQDGKAIVVCPIAFVSEHIETLVELDVEYRHLAEASGARAYMRAAAPGLHPGFVETLADAVDLALAEGRPAVAPMAGQRICPASCGKCPARELAV